MKRGLILAALVLFAPTVGRAGAPPVIPLEKVVDSLVRDLGAEPYHVRERATEALRRIGQPARKVIEEAAKSDDPEICVRARDILADLRLGVGPDWPAEIVLLIRHYDRHDENQRYAVLQRIQAALGTRATPFLIARMEAGSRREADYAFRFLQNMNDHEVWQRVIQLIKEPKNDHQARALAWARSQGGQTLEALETLARKQIPDDIRDQATEAAIQDILAKLTAGKHNDAAAAAEGLAKSKPEDPRFLYLHAEALIALDKNKEALEVRQRALGLNPDKKPPHHLAGDLLGTLGRLRLAAREWQRILDIQPNDSLYDLNAYLSLASIHATNGLFESAAQYLEKALERCAEAKKDKEGMNVVGGTIESLQMEVSRLQQKATQFPAPGGAALEDAIPESEIRLSLEVVLNEGAIDDLRRALAPVAAQFHVGVQPPNLRVFDIASIALRYEEAKKQILVLLRDTAACEPLPFQAKAEEPRAAIHAADCAYIFAIDPATGKGEQIARFDKDYRVTLRPGIKLAAFTDVALQINGQPHKWEKALKGITFDRLPEQFTVIVEGSRPSGQRATVRAKIKLTEPPIVPWKPESPPAAKP